jgi:hypothetical protein
MLGFYTLAVAPRPYLTIDTDEVPHRNMHVRVPYHEIWASRTKKSHLGRSLRSKFKLGAMNGQGLAPFIAGAWPESSHQ